MKWFKNKTPSLPDTPLKDIEILNPITEKAMNNLFVEGAEVYMMYYRAFLATESNDIDLLRKADKFDAITPEGWDIPQSFATLEQAHNLKGELGILVRNAITFAIAITSGPDISTTLALLTGYKPTKPWGDYSAEFKAENPRSAAIAEEIALKHSKRLARDVVACMGFLVSVSNESATRVTE